MAFKFNYSFNGGINMYDVIGVKFELANNIYYFSVNNLSLKKGDLVIVDSENVVDFGTCVTEIKHESKDNLVFPLKKVIRKATKNDMKIYEQNNFDAERAISYAKKCVNDLDLNMNIVSAYYTFEFSNICPPLSSILLAKPCAYKHGLNWAWFLNLMAPNTFF